MDTNNCEFNRFVDLMARLLIKYADRIDISDIEIQDDKNSCTDKELELE